jgi:hypothetical protein
MILGMTLMAKCAFLVVDIVLVHAREAVFEFRRTILTCLFWNVRHHLGRFDLLLFDFLSGRVLLGGEYRGRNISKLMLVVLSPLSMSVKVWVRFDDRLLQSGAARELLWGKAAAELVGLTRGIMLIDVITCKI